MPPALSGHPCRAASPQVLNHAVTEGPIAGQPYYVDANVGPERMDGEDLANEALHGYILNLGGGHYVALRRCGQGAWYYMDSVSSNLQPVVVEEDNLAAPATLTKILAAVPTHPTRPSNDRPPPASHLPHLPPCRPLLAAAR